MAEKKGLEGIIAADSALSFIDGNEKKLTYRGIAIEELAEKAGFEEVVYLLWFGALPNKEELDQFTERLIENMTINESVLDVIKRFPRDKHPMALLRSAISVLSLFDSEMDDNTREANIRKAIRLQAKMATIVAAIGRHQKGKEIIQPKKGLNVAENFLYMLNGKEPKKIEVEAINKALILHADHGLNASTFSSRVTVATLSDIYSGVTSAIGTLKGPLHGGANEAVMLMLQEVGTVENVEQYLQKAFNEKKRIMGIGHRVYKNGDPRADVLKKMSKDVCELNGFSELYEMSEKIEKIVENEKGLKPNVDFYSASVYHSLGFEKGIFTPIFALSRTSGWVAHMLEQFENNRLIRPRANYVGENHVNYIPIEER